MGLCLSDFLPDGVSGCTSVDTFLRFPSDGAYSWTCVVLDKMFLRRATCYRHYLYIVKITLIFFMKILSLV
jgi:hypothetical protein